MPTLTKETLDNELDKENPLDNELEKYPLDNAPSTKKEKTKK